MRSKSLRDARRAGEKTDASSHLHGQREAGDEDGDAALSRPCVS